MSRSGYNEDDGEDNWGWIRWRGAVKSSLRGARGQAFLKELVEAMDAMPVKELHADIIAKDGCYCALGVVAAKRGIDVSAFEPEDDDYVEEVDGLGDKLGIAEAMAREIMYLNDEWHYTSAADRWTKMRAWAVKHIHTNG